MAIITVVSLIGVVLFLLWYSLTRKYKDISKLPGPGVLQIIKNMFDNKKSAKGKIIYVKRQKKQFFFTFYYYHADVFEALTGLNVQYGPVVKLWINPLKPTLVVSDVKYVEYFLTSNLHLDKSDFYSFLMPYIGIGLASAPGDIWKLHRKILNAAFHQKIIEEYVQIFEKYWSQLIEKLKPEAGEPIDIFPILNDYTLHILCETFLELKDPQVDEKYMTARTTFYSIIIERILSFFKRNELLYRFTDTYKKQEDCVEIMNRFSSKIIKNYLASDKDAFLRQQHLMEILTKVNFSDSEIQDHVNTIIIAGHDTSASTLSFGLFELAKHADVQQKILEETNTILGPDRNAEITFHDIPQMKYLDCVLKEILRLYTPVPFFDRKTKEDIVMDGVKIPEGTDISICCYNLHRSAAYFPEPEKFDPDRFAPENIEAIPTFAYVPFSAGTRNCIGKNFAMLEMKSAIAKMVRNFELCPVKHELQLSTEFVLKSESGMRMKFKWRRTRFCNEVKNNKQIDKLESSFQCKIRESHGYLTSSQVKTNRTT